MIPYGRHQISEADILAVSETLRSDFLTTGPKVTAFEAKLCELTGAKHAIACASATAALHLCCRALGMGKDDVGVTSTNTFLASANCIEYCGATADFLDIDPATLCLSPERLEHYCRTAGIPKVVIAVDFAGVPCDLKALNELRARYGFALIEDAAHSVGSTYTLGGRSYQCGCGAHADLTVFSFHPVKNVTTAEGGAVLTNDDQLAHTVRLLRSHGMTKDTGVLTRDDGPWYYEMHELGFHYRINDLQCALGLSQLERLEEMKTRRQAIVERYNRAFADVEGIISPIWPESTSPCFHLYPIQLKEGPKKRRELYHRLMERGISTQVHYIPVHLQPYYRERYGYGEGKCPNAELYYSRCLSLPLYASLTERDVEHVIASLLELL